jgi:hypothetical protein
MPLMTASMQIRLIFFIVAFVSCNTTPEKQNDTKVQQTQTDKCSEPYSIDTSKLKLGVVKNLEVYNGIKFLKLGDNREFYSNCIDCYSTSNTTDTCKIKSNINFLDKDWDVTVYFFNNTLCRLELRQNESSLIEIYEKLQTIFGKPNLQSMKVVSQKESDTKHTIIGNDKRQFRPYTETVNEFLSAFSDNIKNDNQTEIEPISFNRNEMMEEVQKNSYDGGPIKVRIKFYPKIDFQCKWESKIVMQLNINRTVHLTIGQGSSFGDNNKLAYGYEVNPKYETIINLYNNTETIKRFELHDIAKSKRLDSLQKQVDLQEKKKILEQF